MSGIISSLQKLWEEVDLITLLFRGEETQGQKESVISASKACPTSSHGSLLFIQISAQKTFSRGCPSPPELNQTHPHPSVTVVQVHVLHSTYEHLKRVWAGGLSPLPALEQAPESRGSLAHCSPTASQLWEGAQLT